MFYIQTLANTNVASVLLEAILAKLSSFAMDLTLYFSCMFIYQSSRQHGLFICLNMCKPGQQETSFASLQYPNYFPSIMDNLYSSTSIGYQLNKTITVVYIYNMYSFFLEENHINTMHVLL